MKTLKLAEGLTLPLDAVTQTFLVVGKRGSGKSNTAARMVEQMHHARLPFVVLDPTDTWWGLKADREGGRGLDVYVFGGRKADLPLEAGGGTLIAEVLCEHRMPMVLSVKHLSGRERSTFMVAFAQTLFQKWAGGPLHVVLEEAHELAPQTAQQGKEGEQQMLGAFKRLWKLGRAQGIGGTAVTQRPASLSKDITTQSEILIAHRIIGPQDVAAVGEWVKYHGEQTKMLADLPSLPTGEAFIWAPEFPEGAPLGLVRRQVLRRETYDSASTPKVGEQRIEPKELAPVDLERLRTKMAATIEKAKADDPKALRHALACASDQLAKSTKRIKELEARVSTTSGFTASDERKKTEAREILTDFDRGKLTELAEVLKLLRGELSHRRSKAEKDAVAAVSALFTQMAENLAAETERLTATVAARLEKAGFQRILEKLERVDASPKPLAASPQSVRSRDHQVTMTVSPSRNPGLVAPGQTRDAAVQMAKHVAAGQGDQRISGPQQVLLNAMAYFESVQVPTPSRAQVALVAKVSASSSGFEKNMGVLRTLGLVEYPTGGVVQLTAAGRARAEAPLVAPTSAELHDALCARLSGPQGALLRVVIAAYPKTVDRDALATRTNVSANSSGFEKNVGVLRSLGLVDYPTRGQVQAAPVLFLEA